MFKHEKQLFHPVGIERPNPQYAALLQEQLGGGNGELKAAMQYMSQSFRIKDPKIKDLFLDIAAEELGHMEMVAQTINLLNGHDVDAAQVPSGEIQSHVILGLNPGLINASGYAKKHNIPFVIDVEDLWPEAMRMVFDVPVISDILFSYYTVYAKKAYKLADAVVGSSDCYRDEPLKYGVTIPNKVTVYVGNELAAFDQEAAENLENVEKKDGEFWVTYAGTLGTSYDIATLIQAADVLKKRGIEDLRVVLLGDGPMRGEFETLAKELSGNVTFVGYVPHSLMSAYLVKSDVTINSLVRKAAQSIVSKIGDYLASGKPMINTGMDPEFRGKVEEDGFGINVEPESPEALANVIQNLMDHPEDCERMGKIARQIGEEQFDRPTSYKKIIDIVDGLLAK